MDANSIERFQEERIKGVNGPAVEAVNHVLKNGSIILDAGRLVYQEWYHCASAIHSQNNLNDWVADRMHDGGIKFFPLKKDRVIEAQLRSLSVPRSDRKYIHLAQQSGSFGIVSEDTDLFDPSKKGAHSKTKERIKRRQLGPVCRYAKRSLGLEIMPLMCVPDIVPPCGI